ncbi:MAG: cytochrome c, partial [Chloroflexus sp.]
MQTPRLTTRMIRFGWIGLLVLLLTACHQDMYDQQKYTTYEPSSFFADGRSSRPNVLGTTPYEVVKTDEFLYTGLIDGKE